MSSWKRVCWTSNTRSRRCLERKERNLGRREDDDSEEEKEITSITGLFASRQLRARLRNSASVIDTEIGSAIVSQSFTH
jgi:hypothetical protein